MKFSLILALIQTISMVYGKPIDDNGILEVDYPGIGHFTLLDFWNPLHRPVVLLPQSPEHINTKFLLHTRNNQEIPDILKQGDLQAIKNSHFDSKKPSKFIIHGFMDNQLFGPWMRQMKDQFLQVGDYNVFIVDWSGGNGLPYTQATANTRVVGPVVALFLQDLQKTSGLNLNDVHLLGHSLGAHISGYAGARLNGTIGRITGMDPAGPYFEGMPDAIKLNPSNAQFVDAIHTDAPYKILSIGFGMYEMSGHLDFYPNGGHDQPGCENQKYTSIITDGLIEGVRRFSACNHQRAVDFYQASLTYTVRKPVGHQCNDFDAYRSGQCVECGADGSKCAILGMDAMQSMKYERSTRGTRFFLSTKDKYPYFD